MIQKQQQNRGKRERAKEGGGGRENHKLSAFCFTLYISRERCIFLEFNLVAFFDIAVVVVGHSLPQLDGNVAQSICTRFVFKHLSISLLLGS